MNFFEMLCFAKLFSAVMQGNPIRSISSMELDAASEALKQITDQRQDWTQEQKEIYKMMVDCAKEQSKKSN